MYFKRLKELRLDNNLKQEDVAKILGVDRTTYTSFEIGRDTIPIERLNTFVNYFGTSFDYIFGFTNDISFKAFVKDLNIIEIGKRLKDVRKEKKYTQDYIAKILNTNHSVWCRYEQGKYLINTTFLYAFSEKTKVSSDYLLGKTDNPKYFK